MYNNVVPLTNRLFGCLAELDQRILKRIRDVVLPSLFCSAFLPKFGSDVKCVLCATCQMVTYEAV